MDHVMLQTASVTMEEIFGQDPILPEDRPPQFLGSTLASVWQANLEIIYLVVRTGIHMLIPLRLTDSDYVFQLLSPREIFDVHLRRASLSLTNSLHWLLEYSWSRIMNLPAPAPELRCDFTRFYGDRIFQSFFCGARHALKAATGVLAGKHAAGRVRGAWCSLRRSQHLADASEVPGRFHDPELSSCEMRQASPWDHSTDIAMCDCDLDSDALVDRLIDFPAFDREGDSWSSLTKGKSASCAQPQLEDAFRDIKDFVHHSSNIVSPFVKKFYATILNGVVNSASVTLRLVLSAEDVLDGEFFQYPLGEAGYGFREDLALAAWKRAGNPVSSSLCREGMIPETALPGSPCTELSDVVRMHDARLRMYKGEDLCRTTNENTGCTCNPALPVLDNSRCACMLTYPDDERVVADSYVKVRFSQKFQAQDGAEANI